MDDPAAVRQLDCPGKDLDQTGRRLRGPGVAAEPVGQAATGDPFHHEERAPVMEPDLVDLDDVGVLHPRGQLGLTAEPLPLHLGREPAGQDHLQGHRPAQVAMPRLVDDPHPAAPDLAQDDVLPDLAGGRRTFGAGIGHGRARAPELPTQGAGRPLPLGLPLRSISPERRRRPQPAEKAVSHEHHIHRRAARFAVVKVLGDPGEVVAHDRTGGELAQTLGIRVILGVRGQDISLRANPAHTQESVPTTAACHDLKEVRRAGPRPARAAFA